MLYPVLFTSTNSFYAPTLTAPGLPITDDKLSYWNGTAWISLIRQQIDTTILDVSRSESAVVTSGTKKYTFVLPSTIKLLEAPSASLAVAQSSGSALTVDMKQDGASVLSALLVVPNTEKTAKTAVLASSILFANKTISIDVTQVGVGDAAGLKIYLKSSPDNTQDAAETDPFYSSVSALFYFDGTDLSTTFVEEKGNAVTTYGTALLSTANKVMGTAGGQFYGSHDYISIPHNAALEFGSGDFTVEGRVFFDSTGTYVAIYSKYDSSSNIAFTIYKSGSAVVVYASSNGTTWNLLNAVSIIGSISINTWYAIAVTREGNVWKTYVNGTLVSREESIERGRSCSFQIG